MLNFPPCGSGMLAINNINNAKPHNTFIERYAFHGLVGVISLLLLDLFGFLFDII
jgi:hypothetical protein